MGDYLTPAEAHALLDQAGDTVHAYLGPLSDDLPVRDAHQLVDEAVSVQWMLHAAGHDLAVNGPRKTFHLDIRRAVPGGAPA